MSYLEHPPPAPLAPWLECTWERSGDGLPVRVLPDGCIDVIWTEGAETQLVGPNTTAFVVPLDPGRKIVGARFRPGAAPAILAVHAEEVTDVRIVVEHIWPDDGARLAAALDEDSDPLPSLITWLTEKLARAEQPDPIVRATVDQLQRKHNSEQPSVAELANQLSISERQLRRRVASAVGYGPKRLARILRLYRALELAYGGGDLARVALDAGYADQAHFANECRLLAGVPPNAVLTAWTERDRFLQDGRVAQRDDPPHDHT